MACALRPMCGRLLGAYDIAQRLEALGDRIIELDLGLRALERTRMTHDFLVGLAGAVGLDVGFGFPFRIGNEFVRLAATQELFRNAAFLLDHQRRTFLLPDLHRMAGFGGIDLDVNGADDGHGSPRTSVRATMRAVVLGNTRLLLLIRLDMRMFLAPAMLRLQAILACVVHATI